MKRVKTAFFEAANAGWLDINVVIRFVLNLSGVLASLLENNRSTMMDNAGAEITPASLLEDCSVSFGNADVDNTPAVNETLGELMQRKSISILIASGVKDSQDELFRRPALVGCSHRRMALNQR